MDDTNLNIEKKACVKHEPIVAYGRVGQTTECRFCHAPLIFTNNVYHSRNRMSKKARRKLKAITNTIIQQHTT
jgi:hypothetical protein